MKRAMILALAVGATACDSDDVRSDVVEGTLQIEVLDTADLRITSGEGDGIDVSFTSHAGFGLVPVDTPLTASGFAERIPETGDTLYTAKLSAPADPSGPCGNEPVSLALSLHRQGQNPTVLGGVSAYCGADTWYGVPVRVLRLTGPLPLP